MLQAPAHLHARRPTRASSCAATPSTRCDGSRRSREVRRDVDATVHHARCPHGRLRRDVRRADHLAAVPGPDRLPRPAPLRVRAARPGRPDRRGDRQPGARQFAARVDDVLRRRRRRCSRTRAPTCAGRAGRDRDRRRAPPLRRASSSARAWSSSSTASGTSTAAPGAATRATSRPCWWRAPEDGGRRRAAARGTAASHRTSTDARRRRVPRPGARRSARPSCAPRPA